MCYKINLTPLSQFGIYVGQEDKTRGNQMTITTSIEERRNVDWWERFVVKVYWDGRFAWSEYAATIDSIRRKATYAHYYTDGHCYGVTH